MTAIAATTIRPAMSAYSSTSPPLSSFISLTKSFFMTDSFTLASTTRGGNRRNEAHASPEPLGPEFHAHDNKLIVGPGGALKRAAQILPPLTVRRGETPVT